MRQGLQLLFVACSLQKWRRRNCSTHGHSFISIAFGASAGWKITDLRNMDDPNVTDKSEGAAEFFCLDAQLVIMRRIRADESFEASRLDGAGKREIRRASAAAVRKIVRAPAAFTQRSA